MYEALSSQWTLSEGDYRSGILREGPADDETDIVPLVAHVTLLDNTLGEMHRAVIGERLSPRVTWTACCSPRRRGCSRATPRARRSR